MTDTPGPGHNMPPKHEAFAMALDDVRHEAGNFLDGAPIETQAQADAVGVIVSRARQIRKDADEARKEDKRPHDEAAAAVQVLWKPILEKAEDIISAGQKPLAAWLQAEDDRQRAEAEKTRQDATARQQEAAEAQRQAGGDVDATERARTLQRDADAATKLAAKAEKAKPRASGETRAIGLRSNKVATVTDRRALLEWVMVNDAPALTEFLSEYARKALPAQLPGVTIETERKAA